MADVRTIEIDFTECTPGKERIYIPYGSFAYELMGVRSDGKCVMRYGGDVENPNWGERLATNCAVPATEGKKIFEVQNLGVNFSPIVKYCGEPTEVIRRELNLFNIAVLALVVVISSTILYITISKAQARFKSQKSGN